MEKFRIKSLNNSAHLIEEKNLQKILQEIVINEKNPRISEKIRQIQWVIYTNEDKLDNYFEKMSKNYIADIKNVEQYIGWYDEPDIIYLNRNSDILDQIFLKEPRQTNLYKSILNFIKNRLLK